MRFLSASLPFLLGALVALPAACSSPADPPGGDPDARGDADPLDPDGAVPTIDAGDGAVPTIDAGDGSVPPIDGNDGSVPPPIDAGIDAGIDAAIDAPISAGCAANPPMPTTEVPDGTDNDCDGLVDELLVCATGGNFTAIGPALNAAPPGGTIFVCAGTYHERLVISQKPVVLQGQSGAALTILDGDAGGPVITITGTTGTGASIEGFTIRNGRTTVPGAGIRCQGSTLHVAGSLISANVAVSGAGLYAESCALNLDATRFEDNLGGAFGGTQGGGALLVNSTGEIKNGAFLRNQAVNGGGLAILGTAVAITNNDFRINDASLRGGGIYSDSDSPINNNRILENTAGLTGGGLHTVQHAPEITNNAINANTSGNDGGGIYMHQGSARLIDNQFLNNESGDDGGGIRAFESACHMERNLIAANHSAGDGGGVRISHVPCTLIDNLVRDNYGAGYGGGMSLDNDASTVRGGEITGNQAGGSGGGIHAWLAPWTGLRLENILIADNRAYRGGGIFLDDNFTPVTMKRLVIRDNFASRGGGIMVRATNYTLTNSVLEHNEAIVAGGGIYAGVPSRSSAWEYPCPCPPTDPAGTITFTVFHGNEAPEGAAVWTDMPRLTVQNSIMSENLGMQVTVKAPVLPPDAPPETPPPALVPPTWRWNDTMPPTFDGMTDPTGADGNLATSPQFVDAAGGDFHLAPGSACVNAGDPAVLDADGTRADLGMYGGAL